MERVAGFPAVGDRIGERPDHVVELDDRTRPPVREHERQRVAHGGAGVEEVDGEVVDRRRELRPRVHPCRGGGEVVVVAPVGGKVADEVDGTPCDQSSTVSRSGHRVFRSRACRSSTATGSKVTSNGAMSTFSIVLPVGRQTTPRRRNVS